jgi:hypothetical protein
MTRKTKGNKAGARQGTASPYGDGFKGFVDITLNDNDKDALEQTVTQEGFALLVFILEAAEDGYKFSLVADPQHHSFIATLTGRHEGCENLGWALSARSVGPLEACIALWYKHCKLANYGPWLEAGREKNIYDDRWS